MEIKEAIQFIGENSRNSISPEKAKEIVEAFGLKFVEQLAYTELRYREDVRHLELPRVAIYELAEFICVGLNLKPDKAKLDESNIYFGEGRRVGCITEAYYNALKKKFG